MSEFLEKLKTLVTTVSDALAGPIVPAVVAIGQDVLDLIDGAKEVAENDDVEELEALRETLEPLVLAHADATERTLRGEG